MKLAPVLVLLVAFAAIPTMASADPPRSEVLYAGKGTERPRPGDHVVVYRSALDARNRPTAPSPYLPVVTRVRAGTPEGDVLLQMVVGQKRRYWRAPARPGAPETVIGIELIAIAGARAPEQLPMPPPHDAHRLPNGVASLVIAPGDGEAPPGLMDRVRFRIAPVDPRRRAQVRPIPTGPLVLADVPAPGLIDALRLMVAGEQRYVWVPALENAGKPMAVRLTLLEVEREKPPRPGEATPPAKARRTKSGVPYVILRRGRQQRALMPQDHVTYRYTLWRRDGTKIVSRSDTDSPILYQPDELQEVLQTMARREKRRLWLASVSHELGGLGSTAASPAILDVELVSFRRRILPLPDGMRITWSYGKLTVARRGVSAPLPFEAGRTAQLRDRWTSGQLEAIAPSADGASVEVSFVDDCDNDTFVLRFRVEVLKARLENAAALRLHRAGKHAAAEQGFRSAVALDPGFELGYTNLASALALQGKTREAVDALRPLIASNPALVYFKILDDPELASLAQAPEILALRAPAKGTARVDPLATPVVWSETHQLLAAIWKECSGADSRYQAVLWIASPDGALLVRAPLVHWDETVDDCYHEHCKDAVLPSKRPLVAARRQRVNQLLADLGFSPVPGAVGRLVEQQGRPTRVIFPAARLALVQHQHKVRLVRGNDVLAEADDRGDISWAMHLPGMIVYGWGRGAREGCEGTDPNGIEVIRGPRLP